MIAADSPQPAMSSAAEVRRAGPLPETPGAARLTELADLQICSGIAAQCFYGVSIIGLKTGSVFRQRTY